MVEQAQMEMHKALGECPFETHCQLIRATFDRVCAFARLNDVQFPDWYISTDDLVFEEGPGVAGTFGEVREATWFHGGERRRVMVKQLFQDSAEDTDREIFEQFELWKKLSANDHILKFHGGSHVSQPQFFVCEYASYGSSNNFMADEKNQALMWPLFLQVAEGLKALHSHGIVHGELKSSNILIDAEYTAKLADFKFTSARMHAKDLNSSAARQIGDAVRWKPKEVLERSDVTGPQSEDDIYSLGMCMIENLTYNGPFGMVSDAQVVERILRGESHPRLDGVTDTEWDLISQLTAPVSTERPALDVAIEKIRELIVMQTKEADPNIWVPGKTVTISIDESGTVTEEEVKTEVFRWTEDDDVTWTKLVRTTTRTKTFVNGEQLVEVTVETQFTMEQVKSMETEIVEREETHAEVTAAMYSRYDHEKSNIESLTFSDDIDVAVQEIHRACTGAASDEAALASLLLAKTLEQRYLIYLRYRNLYNQSLAELVKSKSEYGILLRMLAT